MPSEAAPLPPYPSIRARVCVGPNSSLYPRQYGSVGGVIMRRMISGAGSYAVVSSSTFYDEYLGESSALFPFSIYIRPNSSFF